jgi:ATP-dependent Clp protease ATP-binding subunit ClpA
MEEINNDLISLFQNALENGYIIDSKGGKISIKNALFIFSMNEIKENYAFKFNSRPNKNSFDQIEEKIGYKLFSMIDDVLIFDRIDMSDYKNIVINELKKNNFTFETSKIPDIDESILSSNGGDAALKKAKEILKNKKILKIK